MNKKILTLLFLLTLLTGQFFSFSPAKAYVPNDPLYSYQSVLQRINIASTWDITTGSDEITIAVIDTGIDIDHPDLVDNIWLNEDEIAGDGIDNDENGYIDDVNGWDFLNDTADVQPRFDPLMSGGVNHGTVVASIIAASGDNNQGIAGISYYSKIMPLEVLDVDGVGNIDDTIRAINYAVANGADIINMSFVGHDYDDRFLTAVKQAYEAGVIVVAAAGNDTLNHGGDDLTQSPVYPACLDQGLNENFVIGVAAVDEKGIKTNFSNYGNCIDISAPGTRMFAAMAFDEDEPDYQVAYGGYWTGTSVATPLVSGAIALIKSINPSMPIGQVVDALGRGADDVDILNPDFIGQLGVGILDIAESIESIYREMEAYKQAKYIVTGAGVSDKPKIKIFKSNGYQVGEFLAYPESIKTGLNVAVGNVMGDDEDEIIVVPKTGGGAHLKIFDRQGNLLQQFFVYDKAFRGGVNVVVGDLDQAGYDEIVVAPMSKMEPRVRVLDYRGFSKGDFLAYEPTMQGGVSLAILNLGYWNNQQILTGAGLGSGPQVSIFDMKGNVQKRFFAFLENFHGGINVAAGDVDGDLIDEIVVGVNSKVDAYFRIFNTKGYLKSQTLAYPENYFGGVKIAMADLNNDGLEEIITGTGVTGGPQVRIFGGGGEVKAQFFAYSKDLRGGVSVAAIEGEE
jgi:subtilisin family serine protease